MISLAHAVCDSVPASFFSDSLNDRG